MAKALPELIEALHNQTDYDWIRILYLHPDNFELQWTELPSKSFLNYCPILISLFNK